MVRKFMIASVLMITARLASADCGNPDATNVIGTWESKCVDYPNQTQVKSYRYRYVFMENGVFLYEYDMYKKADCDRSGGLKVGVERGEYKIVGEADDLCQVPMDTALNWFDGSTELNKELFVIQNQTLFMDRNNTARPTSVTSKFGFHKVSP